MATSLIKLDGSKGEGGGQILRTALALSVLTGTPIRIDKIRAGRAKPGLMRQHLTCVQAAARVGAASVEGDAIGSQTLVFRPQARLAGTYNFAIGTAGSTTLVLQTVLPMLLTAEGPSTVTVEGGTHNPLAPTYEFLAQCWAPQVERLGCSVELTLERAGYFPAGGGRIVARVEPIAALQPFELHERGETRSIQGLVRTANLERHIAEREAQTLEEKLDLPARSVRIEPDREALGPGNAVLLTLASAGVTEVFSGIGRAAASAEQVASEVAKEAQIYLARNVPVGPHLADQLLLPLALAGGGSFTTGPLSRHTTTNMATIETFLPLHFRTEELGKRVNRITVVPGAGR